MQTKKGGIKIALIYKTRDAKGNDIEKTVEFKKYKSVDVEFTCICGTECKRGVNVKNIVSANFTDWQYVGDYICEECSKLFTLFPYSYIISGPEKEIKLLNIREMAEVIQKIQKPPFKIVISKSQKKHLFYKAVFNDNPYKFIANLEEEQIQCNLTRLTEQFLFIGSLQALGSSKTKIAEGEICAEAAYKFGHKIYLYLQEQLKTRQIQIPLHLSQKPEISKEDALCNLDLILNR